MALLERSRLSRASARAAAFSKSRGKTWHSPASPRAHPGALTRAVRDLSRERER